MVAARAAATIAADASRVIPPPRPISRRSNIGTSTVTKAVPAKTRGFVIGLMSSNQYKANQYAHTTTMKGTAAPSLAFLVRGSRALHCVPTGPTREQASGQASAAPPGVTGAGPGP